MGLCQNTLNNNQNNQVVGTQVVGTSLVKTTVRKIDQMQKEARLQSACEGCEGSLFANIYNTKPVNFYLCSGALFTVFIPDYSGTQVTLFRIEDVKDDGVIVRLLTVEGDVVTCTNYTAILDLNCCCGMQCYPEICCDRCNRNCEQTAAV